MTEREKITVALYSYKGRVSSGWNTTAGVKARIFSDDTITGVTFQLSAVNPTVKTRKQTNNQSTNQSIKQNKYK